jgi:uracil-DNA glycosylase
MLNALGHNFFKKLPLCKDSALAKDELLLWHNIEKKLSCYYAPFDHVNQDAKIIIVGITPGRTQMNRALNALRNSLNDDHSIDQALKNVKQHASLSGTMRSRIIDILNKLGYAKALNISCTSSLWSENSHLVHFCSLLKYPVFINNKDYCGQTALLNSAELTQLLHQEFVKDLASINPDALLVPLGEMVANIITELRNNGSICQQVKTYQGQVVAPPHPSGANAESIALLLTEHFPTLSDYQQQMYQTYLSKQSWLKRVAAKPQPEQRYKKARASRWYAVADIRKAYEI